MINPPPQPVESIFARSWDLLSRNWIIIVPGIVIGIIMAVIATMVVAPLGGQPTLADVAARGPGMAIAACLSFLAYVATQAYTIGMAGAAWERGTATLADGSRSLSEDAGRIVVTTLGLFLVWIVAGILALFTLGLSLVACGIFTIYALPSAIIGNRDGFASIAESFRIARMRFVPTLILVIVLVVVSVGMSLLTVPFALVPFLGPVIAAVVQQAVVAFVTLCVVGEYLNLRDSAALAPPARP